MKTDKNTPDDRASEVQRKNALIFPNIRHSYYITLLMGITTTIAGLHIVDLWSGIVTMLCALVTIWLVYDTVGGFEDDSI